MERDTTMLDIDTVGAAEPEAFAYDTQRPETVETAVFGMGCFWKPDAYFGVRDGVVATRVGYASGQKDSPSYHDLGKHTECIRIQYDADTISYEELLDLFLRGHDPGTKQKRQYRSVVLTTTDRQRELAEEKIESMNIVTEIESVDAFHLAENYHQKYRLRHAPDVRDFLQDRYSMAELLQSTVAARLNGYVAGWGDIEQFNDADGYRLKDEVQDTVRELHFRNKHVNCC